MEIRIVIDDRLVDALRGAKRVFSRHRLAAVLAVGVLASAVVAIGAPVEKPNTFVSGDVIRAADMNANFDALVEAINGLVIREDRTVALVEADGCAGLKDALAELDEARIVSTAIVTIQLGAGVYNCSEPLALGHANGSRLHLVGGGASQGDVTLKFPANVDGLVVEGAALGLLENLTLAGGDGTQPNTGLAARQGGSLDNVSNVTVRDFRDGVAAVRGGTITGTNVASTSNGRHGFYGLSGGLFGLTNATATDNGGDGYRVAEASVMSLSGCAATGSAGPGFGSYHGSTIYAASPVASGNNDGFFATGNGTLAVTSPTATNNARFGFYATRGGVVDYSGGTVSGNGTAPASPVVNTANASTAVVIN